MWHLHRLTLAKTKLHLAQVVISALMATCARCGVHFANVMQMGAHTRLCLRSSSASINYVDTDETFVEDAPNAAPEAQVVAPNAATAALIYRPVSSLQSLARRKKKDWGKVTSVIFDSRPESSSDTLARDFREVCVSLRRSTEVGLCIHVLLHVYMRFVFVQFCTYTLNMFT